MERLSNEVRLDVVSVHGRWLREQVVANSMLVELCPDLLDPPREAQGKELARSYWLGIGIIVVDLKVGRTENTVIDAAFFERPIYWKGREYFMYFGWGSNAKDLRVFGLVRDVLKDAGVLHTWETAMRFRRHVADSGYYAFGRGVTKLRLADKTDRFMIDGMLRPMGDGLGYVTEAYWNSIHHEVPPQEAGTPAKSAPQAIERVDLQRPGVLAELMPHIDRQVEALSDFKGYWASVTGGTFDLRRAAIEAGLPATHPWMWEGWRLELADRMRRATTSVALPEFLQYVAVPCLSPIMTKLGWWQLIRYPIQSNGNQRCVQVTEVEMGEQDWLDEHECAQYTLTAVNWALSCKGMVIIVKELPDGLDMILCRDDVKLSTYADIKQARAIDVWELEVVVACSAHIGKGGMLGVNYELWENFGGDYDGDRVFTAPVGDMPNFIQAHLAMRGPGETRKLPKHPRPVRGPDIRSRMLVSAASPMLGQTVNFFSTLAGSQPEGVPLYEHLETMAQAGGWKNLEDMLGWFDEYVRLPTDWLKTFIEAAPWVKQLGAKMGKIQHNEIFSIPRWPAFIYWKHALQAFREWVPILGYVPEWVLKRYEGEDKRFRASQYLEPMYWHGSVGTIFRLTRERVAPYMDVVLPRDMLTKYLDWAEQVTDQEIKIAQHFYQDYLDFNSKSVDWNDDDSIMGFRTWVKSEVAKSKLDRRTFAHALWRVAHSSTSPMATASVVFVAFPEESVEIIKAGLKREPLDVIETSVVGLEKQLPAYTADTLELEVSIVEFREMGPKKRPRTRYAVVGKVVGQIQPADSRYPTDMLGVIPMEGSTVPDVGVYHAEFKRHPRNKGWWFVTLRRV